MISLLITVLAIGGVIYHFSEKALLSTAERNLQAHADFRKGRILAFIESQKSWMETVSENREVAGHIEQLVGVYQQQGEESELYRELVNHFKLEYGVLVDSSGSDELFVLSPQGELVFTLNSAREDVGAELTAEGLYGKTILSELIEQVMTTERLASSQYGYLEMLEGQTVLMGAPILSTTAEGKPHITGILVRPLSLGWLREMLSHYSGLGETGDVVIAQKERVLEGTPQVHFINILRSTAIERTERCAVLQSANPERFPMLRLASKERAFAGEMEGSGWVMDPKCQEVYSVWSWIPELNWGMVVKQDREELLQPVQELRESILIAILFSMVILLWVTKRQAESMAKPIEELIKAAHADEIERFPAGRVREINQLSEAIRNLVSSLHRNEEQLEEKEFVELILNSIEEGMLVLDNVGEVVKSNRVMRDLVGKGAPYTLSEIYKPLASEGEPGRGMIKTASAELIPVEMREIELQQEPSDGSTTPHSRLVLFYDLRDRIRMEEQEHYLAFQSGIAEMSMTLMHNVGNALTGINGNICAMEQKTAQLERIQRSLEELSERCMEQDFTLDKAAKGFTLVAQIVDHASLQKMVDGFKSGLSRIEGIVSSHRAMEHKEEGATQFSLDEMVKDSIDLLQSEYDQAEVELVFESLDLLHPYQPRNQMVQMMINLLRNSLEALQRRQQMEAELKRRVKRRVKGRVSVLVQELDSHTIRLTVSDNGIGMDQEQQSKLFLLDFSSGAKPGGYGLHSVANFINSIRGSISVRHSAPMSGTTMEVTFPKEFRSALQPTTTV